MISCEERRDDRYTPPVFVNRWADDCQGDQADLWTAFGSVEVAKPKNFDIQFSSVLENAKQLSLFVDMDNEVLGGTPRIGGTRIPIYRVLNAIDEYGSIDGVITAYRSLTVEQVRDAVQFAAHVLEYPVEHQTETADR
jgi:uncharacterized protein (DUF433 family)